LAGGPRTGRTTEGHTRVVSKNSTCPTVVTGAGKNTTYHSSGMYVVSRNVLICIAVDKVTRRIITDIMNHGREGPTSLVPTRQAVVTGAGKSTIYHSSGMYIVIHILILILILKFL